MGIAERVTKLTGWAPVASALAVEQLASPWADSSHLADVDLAALFGVKVDERVTRENAMQLDVVAKSCNTVKGTIGRLPLYTEKGDKRPQQLPSLITRPDPALTRETILSWTVDDLIFYPASFWVITKRDAYNFPADARRLPRDRAEFDSDGNVRTAWGKPIGDYEGVIRFDSPTGGLLSHGADVIRRALAINRSAARAEDNPVPTIELHNESNVDLSPTQIDDLVKRWTEKRRLSGVAYTSKSLKAIPHGQQPEQLLIDARKQIGLSLARHMGVPAWLADLPVEGASLTYNNRASRNWELIDLACAPYMSAIASRLSLPDVTPNGWQVRFDLDELTRPDQKTRFETYAIGIEKGFVTQEQIATWEGWSNA